LLIPIAVLVKLYILIGGKMLEERHNFNFTTPLGTRFEIITATEGTFMKFVIRLGGSYKAYSGKIHQSDLDGLEGLSDIAVHYLKLDERQYSYQKGYEKHRGYKRLMVVVRRAVRENARRWSTQS